MKTPRVLLLAIVILGAAAAALPLGCFSLREPPCAFSCVQPPHRCPEQYTCGADGLCHREGSTNVCTLTPPGDAGGDATGGGDVRDGGDAADSGDSAAGDRGATGDAGEAGGQ